MGIMAYETDKGAQAAGGAKGLSWMQTAMDDRDREDTRPKRRPVNDENGNS
jgi:hypothetical protein